MTDSFYAFFFFMSLVYVCTYIRSASYILAKSTCICSAEALYICISNLSSLPNSNTRFVIDTYVRSSLYHFNCRCHILHR